MKERLDYISNLRFPMILGVVFTHALTYMPTSIYDDSAAGTTLQWIIALAHGRIPTFFIISGYLFFRGVEQFDWALYKKRMKSRNRSLIIPYILWTIICLCYLSIKALPIAIQTHDYTPITNMLTWRIFWVYTNVHPLHIPLWYIRDLIVMSIISPLVWIYLKYTKHFGMLILIGLYIAFDGIIAFTLPNAILFFTMGAYFALFNVDFRPIANKLKWLIFPILLLVSAIITLGETYSARTAAVVIPLTYLCISAYVTDKYHCKISDKLTNSVFFIYASHTILITSVVYSAAKFIIPDSVSPWILLMRHMAVTAVIVTICVALYHLLKRFIPKTISILTGSR